MSDVPPDWSDIVAALASVPKEDERTLVGRYVWSFIEREPTFDDLGKNRRKFYNAVMDEICEILARARHERGEPHDDERVPWLAELLGDDISELPFDVNDIAAQIKALFDLEWRMEPSEYEAKLAALHGELADKLVKDMFARCYFNNLLNEHLKETR